MLNKIKKIVLVLFCLYSAFFFVGSTLSPIAAAIGQYDLSAHLTSLFVHSCHQQPDRSFWMAGYPAALCARCYGFYIGVLTSSFFAIFNRLNIKLNHFIILLLLVTIDIIMNVFVNINTGNIARFISGLIMGLIFITCVCFAFKFIKEKLNHEN